MCMYTYLALSLYLSLYIYICIYIYIYIHRFFVRLGGFDTHNDQGENLAEKFRILDAALERFVAELEGQADR